MGWRERRIGKLRDVVASHHPHDRSLPTTFERSLATPRRTGRICPQREPGFSAKQSNDAGARVSVCLESQDTRGKHTYAGDGRKVPDNAPERASETIYLDGN